ncbi:hypothetical protein TRFO_19648 [Tritrichomonas foetus]|uniref:Uncharacterized protein n=1 Tax=Tritrichomonas foetus TaxID=1144522 RepID=A0A1J4KHS5_9EUKA|nr:hypothetical protein [Tritrichomonas foetus]OHT10945.1 hypothetical protein TRFO_19648 [Tritrichomonas foetus]|eukprot:OHT10945.1 hypothetical protein TRFO_19648 [Tritrichomonas foetus]
MSIEYERQHRHFFTTRVPPPPKPAEIFPTASPRAVIELRSGFYNYPQPSADENNLIYKYRFQESNSQFQNSRIQKPPSNSSVINFSFSRQHDLEQQRQESQRRSIANRGNISLCNGSPGHLRLAREYAESKSQSSIMNSTQRSGFPNTKSPTLYSSVYSPSGVF